MIENFLNFINKKLTSTDYLEYYDDMVELLKINQKNIQYLLINNELDFDNIKYYSIRNNKLLFEYINHKNFTNLLCDILNKIYFKNLNYDLNHKTLIGLKNKLNDINLSLKKEGVYIFNNLLNEKKCSQILNKLNNKLYINRNNNIIIEKDLFNNNKDIWWLYNYEDLFNIEIIQHIISSNYLLKIAEDYFKCKPILHNVQFWASYPGDLDTTQKFHQDFDDIKFLKVFIYLNDVNKKNGPHVYVKKSIHNIKKISINDKLSERYDDDIIVNNFKNDIIKICGNAGTMIFEDTHGLHKGNNLKNGKRFVLQLVYGISSFYHLKNSNYKKYKCNIEDHNIIYNAFLKFPYSYMNFTFHQ